MLLKSINLTNFRNHLDYHLDFNLDTTLILGENGCGKTSVLEAIYLLTQGKSFRTTHDTDIIKTGKDFYRAELEYDTGEKAAVAYDGANKTFKILDKKVSRLLPEDRYPVILFQPSDLNLVSQSNSVRRRYFDQFFSILDPEYASAVNKYERAVIQRNKLLKTEFVNQTAMFPWNVLLTKTAIIVEKLRVEFIYQINQIFTDVYHSIANNQDMVSLRLSTEVKSFTENEYLRTLEQNFEKDRIVGHTTFGIHRDHIEFIFNHKFADSSASRGETRSMILALKFIEAILITRKLNKKPIILLDDVFSELDNKRRAALIENFKNHQVIITSVEKFTEDLKL